MTRRILFIRIRRRWSKWHLHFSGVWFLQIQSQLPPSHNKLGVYRRGWMRSILFNRTPILSVEQAVHRPNTLYLGALSTFACTMQDVVWSDHAQLDLDDSYAWDFLCMGVTAVKNTVCLSLLEFCLPLSIPNLWWSVNWLHIPHDKCTRRICSESRHCSVVKDQRDCVLNDLEELEGKKKILVVTGQYSIEIFYCCLRLLPYCSSIHHQTNIESNQICSEDHLSISRTRSLHLLLEVVLRVEDECLFLLPLGMLDRIEVLVQYQSMFFQE